ncbi:hypothetical protein F1559_000704 [Cyanidiococcus yangmingshanensis]|uniref:Uncharacterized protein n=1 Tax=Cyanidiococcus yangmingshanensis TaxID=2690220 RepID=A0A7J7IC30_9RHOD|nr:hypothetical protein F1559_000704 [Cyanidiococcus yangmingshanensis]
MPRSTAVAVAFTLAYGSRRPRRYTSTGEQCRLLGLYRDTPYALASRTRSKPAPYAFALHGCADSSRDSGSNEDAMFLKRPPYPPVSFYVALLERAYRRPDPCFSQLFEDNVFLDKLVEYVAKENASGDPSRRIEPMDDTQVDQILAEWDAYQKAVQAKLERVMGDPKKGVKFLRDDVDYSIPPDEYLEQHPELKENIYWPEQETPGYDAAVKRPRFPFPPIEFDPEFILERDPFFQALPKELSRSIMDGLDRLIGPVRKWAYNDTSGLRFFQTIYFSDPIFTDDYVPVQGTGPEFEHVRAPPEMTWETQQRLSGNRVLDADRVRATCAFVRRFYADFGTPLMPHEPLNVSVEWFFEALRVCRPRPGNIFVHWDCGDGRWLLAAITAFDFACGRGIIVMPDGLEESDAARTRLDAVQHIMQQIEDDTLAAAAAKSAKDEAAWRAAYNMEDRPYNPMDDNIREARKIAAKPGESIKFTSVMVETNGRMLFDADVLLCPRLDALDLARVKIGCRIISMEEPQAVVLNRRELRFLGPHVYERTWEPWVEASAV